MTKKALPKNFFRLQMINMIVVMVLMEAVPRDLLPYSMLWRPAIAVLLALTLFPLVRRLDLIWDGGPRDSTGNQ